MTTKVVKGSLWTIVGQIVPLAVSLISTGYVIRLLGAEGYGVLVLCVLIPNFLSFADFGMSIASTKFASEAYAAGDGEREAGVVRTAALIAAVTSVPLAAAMILFSSSIISIFSLPDHLRQDAGLTLKFTAASLVITFLNGIFNTPQLTRLRMDLNTFANTGFRVLGQIATPLVLMLGGGIIAAVCVLLAANLLTLLTHMYISRRLLPALLRFSFNPSLVGPMAKFGGTLAGAGIAHILIAYSEKGLLASLSSTEALGFYSIAFTLCTMIMVFSSSMVQSLLPAFSQLLESKDRGTLNLLYSRCVRLNLILLIPALVFLALAARPFFTNWANEDVGRESTFPFYILLTGLAINVPAFFPHSAIIASGRSDIIAKVYWLEVVPYVLTVWFLTSRYGIVGAALAWSIRAAVDSLIFFLLAKKIGGVSYTQRNLPSFALAFLIMLVPLASLYYFGSLNLAIIGISLISATIYAVIVWKNVLERDEVLWLEGQVTGYFARGM
jgi:O-antigen/teichoic acid export membrane protein